MQQQPSKMLTRMAPTPSGFLHAGNIYNFLLNWLAARKLGGQVLLRIDDLDAARMRPEYLDDIFRVLEAVGLDWDVGPAGPDDFMRNWSQKGRTDRYVKLIEMLNNKGFAYACTCSRKELAEKGLAGKYPGFCRHKNHILVTDESALRLNVTSLPEGCWAGLNEQNLEDPVILRRDGIPAYHIGSICDDLFWGVTHVYRGQDLKPATEIQQVIASAAGLRDFANIEFEHHPLLVNDEGEKLSKSAGANSFSLLDSLHNPVPVILHSFARWKGMELKDTRPEKAADLLDFYID
jgi:glutamyl/glutaminyl-tRNA synthetase